MATFYLDYEGGSDAADGTTFANRWKTITSGATAARIAPGDVIRVMGSPDPVSLGITATWTNKSATVTLASALNVLVTNCDTAWTASANVTSTADTGIYRTSTGSAKQAIAAGFTTGKVAYFDLGSNQDYSAYQGVTFWFRVGTTTLAAGVLTLDFCSDALGATPVDTFAIPAISQTGQWVPVYVNKGSALGAAIRSISINAISDPGTIDLFIDNISTVKAAGNDALTLRSLIGKNVAEDGFWAIRGISGTTITLDITPSMTVSTTNRGYYGTTESVTTYKRETIRTDLVAAAGNVQAIQDSGSAGSVITFSGGWNRTDMSTQTLQTWFDGQSGVGRGLYASAKTFIKLERLAFTRYDYGIYIDASCNNWELADVTRLGNCLNGGLFFSGPDVMTFNQLEVWQTHASGLSTTNGSNLTFGAVRLRTCGQAGVSNGWTFSPTGGAKMTTLEIYNSVWIGLSASSGGVTITTATIKDCGSTGFDAVVLYHWRIGTLTVEANGFGGADIPEAHNTFIENFVGTNNASGYGLNLAAFIGSLRIGSLTTSLNASGGVHLSTIQGRVKVNKSSMAEATKVAIDSAANGQQGHVSFHKFNGTADDHRGWYAHSSGATINSETTVRHTASGVAWKISPLSTAYINDLNPVVVPLTTIMCNAGTAVTVKVWMRRTHTELTGILRCRGGQIDGVAADVTDSIGAAADTWEEQSITFTPSVIGAVEIDIVCYGGTTRSLYVDDMSVSQA